MGILIILAAAAFGFVFVDVLRVHHQFNGLLNFKPFNCQNCVSGWSALVFCLFAGINWFWIIPVMCWAMITNVILNGILNRVA